MRAAAQPQRTWVLLFAGIVTAIYTTALVVVGQLPHLDEPAAVAVGVTLDLVVVVPLAFYLLFVRRGVFPGVTLVPVVVASGLAASLVLPADHQQALRVLEILAVPIELALVGWIGWRAARVVRNACRGSARDLLERFHRAAFELTGHHRAAAVVASEIAVFYYAVGSWRARAHVAPGTVAFTHHRRSGYAGIVLAFVLVMAVEGIAVHVLLLQWSALAAWIFTIGTAYGALWLIGDYRATVLRPILVSDQSIVVRAGFRCTIELPLARIAAVGRDRPDFGRESVSLKVLGSPTHWLVLTEPMMAEGPYGFRRRVRAIGIEPDRAEDFDRLLGRAM